MQTFLPHPSFVESARALDYRRLGKQRVEAWQILQTLRGASAGWQNHPAVRMWRGSEAALVVYGLIVCRIWRALGYRDSMLERFQELGREYPSWSYPPWFFNPAFHDSHKAALVAKDEAFYGPKFPGVVGKIEYIWPT